MDGTINTDKKEKGHTSIFSYIFLFWYCWTHNRAGKKQTANKINSTLKHKIKKIAKMTKKRELDEAEDNS